MVTVNEAINFVWKLSVLAEVALAVRLLLQGLGGKYPALLTSSLILPIKSLLLIFLYSTIAGRGWLYHDRVRELVRDLEPVEWVLLIWIVFELLSRWTRGYLAVGRLGKTVLLALLIVALSISLASSSLELRSIDFTQRFKVYYVLNRVIWGVLAVFLLGMNIFFRCYPVPIVRNVVRYTQVATLYFLSVAASNLAMNLGGIKSMPWTNLSIVAITLGCFSAWAILMTREGQAPVQLPHVSQEDKDRIAHLNDELLVFMGEFPKVKR